MVGAARTGSTLLRHVLNRAPDICLASETHFLRWSRRADLERMLSDVRNDVHDQGSAVRHLAKRFYEPDSWVWLSRNVTPEELAERLAATDLTLASVFALLLDLYAERRCGLTSGRGVIGEKTPEHLNEVLRLLDWFPDAVVVHTFRDPRAIYASQLRRLRQGRWGPKARLPWLRTAAVDWLLAPVEAVRTARAWQRAVHLHERYTRALGVRYRLVRFEDLIARPEAEVRAICELVGIEFRATMLEGTDVVGSSFEGVRHGTPGFDPAALTRWRREIHPLARTWFSAVLGHRLATYGYDP